MTTVSSEIKLDNGGQFREKQNATPTFGIALSGKRARCSTNDFLADGSLEDDYLHLIGNKQENLSVLQRICHDGFKASAAKGRILTLMKDASYQQKNLEKYTDVVGNQCVPIFDVLTDLSTELQEECETTFHFLKESLDRLSQSAQDVKTTIKQLVALKNDQASENAELQLQAKENRDVLAARNLEIEKMNEMLSNMQITVEEKRSGQAHIAKTTRPIKELAAQRQRERDELYKKHSSADTKVQELIASLAAFRAAHDTLKSEKLEDIQKLHHSIEGLKREKKQLSENFGQLEKEQAELSESKNKEKSSLTLLRAQVESYAFCLDLLLTRVRSATETIDDLKNKRASAEEKIQRLCGAIEQNKTALQELLCTIEKMEADLKKQNSLIENELRHTISEESIMALETQLIAARKSFEDANSCLALEQEKLLESSEKLAEKEEQILIFAEEMNVAHEIDSAPKDVAAIATAKAVEKLEQIRSGLSSTVIVLEDTIAKKHKLQSECASVKQTISEVTFSSDYPDAFAALEALKEKLLTEIASAETTIEETARLISEKESQQEEIKLKCETIQAANHEIRAEWDKKFAELESPTSEVRKRAAEEELATCDQNFRDRINSIKAEMQQAIEALKKERAALQAETAQQEALVEKLNLGCERDVFQASDRASHTSSQKIHRSLGRFQSRGGSLSSPHLNALREKLASCSQVQSKTMVTQKGLKYLHEGSVRRIEAEFSQGSVMKRDRAAKGRVSGRRSGGAFDIFAA